MLFTSGTNAGKSTSITDYTITGGVFTFATTGTVVAGVTYTASQYDRNDVVRAINQALQECGVTVDTDSSLTGDSSTMEFTLPSGVSDVRRVLIGTSINYKWTEVDGKLIFDSAPGSDTINIYYAKYPAVVILDAHVLPIRANPLRLKWTAVYYALFNRVLYAGNDAVNLKDALTMAQTRMTELNAKMPNKLIPYDPHYSGMWK